MAVNRWTGAVDTNYETTGNWTTGAKPVDTEDVIVSSIAERNIETGMDNESLIEPASVIIESGCVRNIGSSGLPWLIDTPIFKHFGSGKVYYKHVGTDTPDIVEVDADTPTNDDALVLDGTGLEGLSIKKGKCTVIATMGNLSEVIVSYRNNPSSDAIFNFNGTSTTIAKYVQNGGISYFNGGASSGIAASGCFVLNGGTSYFNSGDAKFVVVTSGRFIFNSTVTLAGAIAVGTGVIDFTQSYNVKTITTVYAQSPANVMRDESRPAVHVITNLRYQGKSK